MALMKMEHDFPVWNSLLGKKGLPFQNEPGTRLRCLEKMAKNGPE